MSLASSFSAWGPLVALSGPACAFLLKRLFSTACGGAFGPGDMGGFLVKLLSVEQTVMDDVSSQRQVENIVQKFAALTSV